MIYNLKNIKMKSTLMVFSLTALFGLSVWQLLQNPASVVNEKTVMIAQPDVVKSNEIESVIQLKKEVKFENVSFRYDTSLFTDVKGETVEASLLEDATNKPDRVYPRHINFVFEKPYAGEQATGKDYHSNVRIHVYPIEDYKKVYAFYGIDSQTEFNRLKKIVDGNNRINPSNSDKQLLYLPFIDSHQAFTSKSKVINFQNGKGLMYLTRWQPDEYIINNGNLELIFQGMSDDNQNFILMEFKVSARNLPKNDDARYPDKYKRLNDISKYSSENYQQLYKKYALETAIELDKMPSAGFTPNMDKIEELIRSFKIE